jgi:Zn-dependent peptidase ImmA (M78 family)
MTNDIKVKYVPYKQISEAAQKVLAKYNLAQSFPIDIDNLVDNTLRINVIPFPYLYKDFGISAITSSDLKKMYVDEYLFMNLDQKYRFTLAHELGHRFIHKDIFRQAKIENLDTYREFLTSLSKEEYYSLEYQADCFAGLFLVPPKQLEEQFKKRVKRITSLVKNKLQNPPREHYFDLTKAVLSSEMSLFFGIHPTGIKIRLEKDNLLSQIP